MEIKSISQKIFRTNSASIQQNSGSHTNPFGVNFKGNMINADVFDVSFAGAKETLAQKAVNKISGVTNKLADAMKVGSINSFVQRVTNYGKKITEGATRLWNTAKSIEIEINAPKILGNLTEARAYSRRSLDEHSSSKLGEMLQSVMATA